MQGRSQMQSINVITGLDFWLLWCMTTVALGFSAKKNLFGGACFIQPGLITVGPSGNSY